MSAILTEDLIYEILSVVEEIPEGKVASYGQIARLIGRDKNAVPVGESVLIFLSLGAGSVSATDMNDHMAMSDAEIWNWYNLNMRK